jgi:hypothetical protein
MKTPVLALAVLVSGVSHAQTTTQTVEGTIKAPISETLLANPIEMSLGVKSATNPDEIDGSGTLPLLYEDEIYTSFGAKTNLNVATIDNNTITYAPMVDLLVATDAVEGRDDDIKNFKFGNTLKLENTADASKTTVKLSADYIKAYDYEFRKTTPFVDQGTFKKITEDRLEMALKGDNTLSLTDMYSMTNSAGIVMKDYFDDYSTDLVRDGQEADYVMANIESKHKLQIAEPLAFILGAGITNRAYSDRVAYAADGSSLANGRKRNHTWVDTFAGLELSMGEFSFNTGYKIQNRTDNIYGADAYLADIVNAGITYSTDLFKVSAAYEYEMYDYKNIPLVERFSVYKAGVTIKKAALNTPFDINLNHSRFYERDSEAFASIYDNIETAASISFQI